MLRSAPVGPVIVSRPPDVPAGPVGLAEWLRARPEQLRDSLDRNGAVCFRGFEIDGETSFARVLDSLEVERGRYVSGNTPRSHRRDGIYTATEYTASQGISLHNEMSYSRPWPTSLYFCCVRPADTGGATTVGDGRRILQTLAALDPALVHAFRTGGVRYVRNLHGGRGLGRSWQATFETDDRDEVSQICSASGTQLCWTESGLRLIHVGPGVLEHPRTGEWVWFNQAEQFHPTSLPSEVARFLLDEHRGREEQLPQWASFADGSPIPEAMLDSIRRVLEAETVALEWQRGDFMMVDNVLALHGRTRYTGPREILVAMA